MSTKKKLFWQQSIAFFLIKFLAFSIILILVFIFGFIAYNGYGVLSFDFIFDNPKNGMMEGGIFPAIVGTLCLMLGSSIFAFPIGIMSGIYLNEYLKDGKLKTFIVLTINSLSGIPSIVFGLFGMSLFVNKLGFGDSILAGSLTLGILALPIIIRNTEMALRRIDNILRLNSFAIGASKWQTIVRVILPGAFGDVITGVILSMGRVSGETAPILFTVAAYFLPKLPTSIFDQVMVLPYHLYVLSTSGTDIEKSKAIAYGTALVLILITLIFNLLANLARTKKR